jgi:serine/threonine protein phosphatase PrpC
LPQSLNLARTAAVSTDVGCVRDHNEDSNGMLESLGLYVVADGMGGAAGGEVASQLAVEAFLNTAREAAMQAPESPLSCDQRAAILREAIAQANRSIRLRAEASPELTGMGCTLVAAWFWASEALIANLGDSRCYLLRDTEVVQLTEDHSLLAEHVRKGLMTPAEAESSPMHSIITRALGTSPDVQADYFSLELGPGDRLLLTSDGLMRHVKDDAIGMANRDGTPQQVCTRLTNLARDGGGVDNITCMLIEVHPGAEPPAQPESQPEA